MATGNDRPVENLNTISLHEDDVRDDVLTRRQIAVLAIISILLLIMALGIIRYWMVNSYPGP